MRITILTAMVCTALLAPPVFAETHDSCGGGCPTPPTCSRAVSADLVPLASYPGNTLSATLAMRKPGTILIADGMLTEPEPLLVSREYDLGISVNALSMQPSGFGPETREAHEDCGAVRSDPDFSCTVIGHWWLDMDDPANAALLGVPITITLVGGDNLRWTRGRLAGRHVVASASGEGVALDRPGRHEHAGDSPA